MTVRSVMPALAATVLSPGITELIAAIDTARPDIYRPRQPPRHWRILATSSGRAELRSDHRIVGCRSGNLVVLGPGWSYRERVNLGPWEVRFLMLRGPWCDRLAPLLDAAAGAVVIERPPARLLRHLSATLEACFRGGTGWDLRAASGLASLLADLLQQHAGEASPTLLGRVDSMTSGDDDGSWTIPELARSLGMSVETFHRRFRSEAGTTPGRWLRDRRLARALLLLADQTPTGVAEQLGFPDAASFSRAFKQRFGVPPSVQHGRSRQAFDAHRI